ncbi:nuclear transport factor 2 family protein [uncultured Ferrimonas sp.]|uniref:nuclear transport factor 2 family protein n=1 Tax=uncultured Ferrimonas sp. TaxID=432640 RepID=UPI0026033E17|nr:nuclear transport factor 2 family protein [uncultured Ferrimonas sp.]
MLICARLCLLALLLLPRLSHAQEQGPPAPSAIAPQLQLATDYLEALTQRDFHQLGRMLHRDTKFHDVMAGKKLNGTRDILTFLRQVHIYTERFAFNVDHQFYKGSTVVLIGSYYYQARGNLFGMPDRLITLTLPGVTTLTVDVETQRIDEHTDMLDYESMKAQLRTYRYEPAP